MQRFTARSLNVESRDGESPKIGGYGAVFYDERDPGTEYELMPGNFERLVPGAFADAIRDHDVRSFFNHDVNLVLGRNRAGTLDLSEDSTGLLYRVTPPNTQTIQDLVVAPIRRGDVSGSSFMFNVDPADVTWFETNRRGERVWIRRIDRVSKLMEVGPVVFPAFKSATSGVRTRNSVRAGYVAERDASRAQLSAADKRRRIARAMEVAMV